MALLASGLINALLDPATSFAMGLGALVAALDRPSLAALELLESVEPLESALEELFEPELVALKTGPFVCTPL